MWKCKFKGTETKQMCMYSQDHSSSDTVLFAVVVVVHALLCFTAIINKIWDNTLVSGLNFRVSSSTLPYKGLLWKIFYSDIISCIKVLNSQS